MNQISNIWGTPEIAAISRDFDHEEYLRFHAFTKTEAAPFCGEAYGLLKKAFHVQMDADMAHRA